MNKKNVQIVAYDLLITVLALASFVIAIMGFAKYIVISHAFGLTFSSLIWVVFLLDYVGRFLKAPSKKVFLIGNTFDLIGLIPSHPVFVFFRLGRLVSMIRSHHLFWKLGWNGRFTNGIHRFLYETGFIYLFSASLLILIFSSLVFAFFEHDSLENSLWWAITTASTVGYGDVVPKSAGGKIIAAMLMFGGIGFIGLLTSTITDFFTVSDKHTSEESADLQNLTNQVNHLSKQVEHLQKSLDEQIPNKH